MTDGYDILEDYPDILTVQDVREILSLGKDKTYRLLKSGEIPGVRIGRDRRVSKRALEKMIPY